MRGLSLVASACASIGQRHLNLFPQIEMSLLPQGTLESVMSIEDNIEYRSAQRKVFKRLADRSVAMIRELGSGPINRIPSAFGM